MNQNYTYFFSDEQKYIFVVCCTISVIRLYVPWDEKGWKSLAYTNKSFYNLDYTKTITLVFIILWTLFVTSVDTGINQDCFFPQEVEVLQKVNSSGPQGAASLLTMSRTLQQSTSQEIVI